MIIELGHYALILALFVALAQSVVPMWGASRNDAAMMAMAKPGAVVLFVLVAGSFAALTVAYVTSDFSVLNVVQNSHTDKPLLYKISGVWGNHEGSLLLWITILVIYGLSVALGGRNLPPSLRARALSVQAMITAGFILFILLTSNPFTRLADIPSNGHGLNPILQDPGLALHPPMLYLGYVGFSMAFSFAIAALIEGRVDAAWARWVRPWTLAAWTFLTLGIMGGSWWAYYELGWGGWWYWDPVENASFMPWLAGTALLHSAVVVEKRDALKSWTILLAILAFALSLVGTFLVRSGVITSVHAFADDPTRGLFVLVLLVGAVGSALALYAWRAPMLKGGGLFAPISREGALLFNNLIMTVAAAVVLLGTVYPLLAQSLGWGKISVGKPFFDAVFVPLMVPMILVMAVAPFLGWKRGDLPAALKRLIVAAAVAVAVLLGVWATEAGTPSALLGAAGCGLAAWAMLGPVVELATRVQVFRIGLGASLRRATHLPRSAWGMTIAHVGIGCVILGVTASSVWKQEAIVARLPGEVTSIGAYQVTLDSVEQVLGANYAADRAHLTVRKEGAVVALLSPEKRLYQVPPMPATSTAIHSTGWGDVYAAVGEVQNDGRWVIRLYWQPGVPFLWYGGLLMGLGGIVSLSDRRHRVGAPVRAKKAIAIEEKA